MSPDQTPQPAQTTPPQPQVNSTPAAPVAPQPVSVVPVPAQPIPVPATTPPAAQQSAPATTCKCTTVNAADWDKKKTTINKTFYKAFSPRLLYYPFSFVIDVLRAQKAALAKGCKVVENGTIMDDGAMFMGNVFVEVTDANPNDPNVLSLGGKEVYTKVSKNEWKNIRLDIAELAKDLGKPPAQLFIWWTSCPKCVDKKEVKAVLIALP